jgi:L-alanine-DL-glutamate epimerase-like enolase superfamily enzyme
MTRITSLTAYEVRVPLPAPLALATQTITARDYTLVEIEDADGARGRAIGYARGAPVAISAERMIAPLWQGQDVDDPAALHDRTARTHAMQGSHGIFWRALSLADLALHDLLSRRAAQPLAVYLGGKVEPVETTLAGCYPVAAETPESIAELMATMAAYGAAGIKVTASGDLAHDTERLRDARRALGGDGPPLIIDLYSSVSDAKTLLPHALVWGELNMGWLEDPFGFDDFDELAKLAAPLSYPVGVGDEQAGLSHFSNLITHGRIGVVRLDATTCGGVTGLLRIARLAATRGRPVSCHVFHHMHAQLAAVTGASIEYMLPQTGVDATHLLVTEDLRWDDGRMVPSSAPGLGMTWDEEALRRYRV